MTHSQHREFAIIGEVNGQTVSFSARTIIGTKEFAEKKLAEAIAKQYPGWENLRLNEYVREIETHNNVNVITVRPVGARRCKTCGQVTTQFTTIAHGDTCDDCL